MSSNVTPIRQQVMQPSQQDWWFPPPQVWPPQQGCPPQPCPPPQQCAPPSCFSQVAKANACWDQSQALYNLVSKVVQDIFITNPGIIPQPPPGSGGSTMPMGITDGSNAQPGTVGEWVLLQASFNYPATGSAVNNVSVGILQPGDWNYTAYVGFSTVLTGSFLSQTGAPGLEALETESYVNAFPEAITLLTPIQRAIITVPTLFAFQVTTNTGGAGQAGQGSVFVGCRRMR